MFGKNILPRKSLGIAMLLVLYFAVAYALMDYFEIPCVFVTFLGIPCPGCGMTRAFLSLLRLDLYSAVRYNVVVFFMPYVFAYVLFDFRHKIHKVLLGIIAIVAIVNWIMKILLFF